VKRCGALGRSPDFGQVHDDFDGLHHRLERYELELAVEVVPAREDVGRGQTLLGQARAVGAAADGLLDRLDAGATHSFERELGDARVAIEVRLHVLVLLDQGEVDRDLGEALLHAIAQRQQERLAHLDVLVRETADEHLEGALGHVGGEAVGVQIPLATLGGFGRGLIGEAFDDGSHRADGVDHLVFGVAGVHVGTIDFEGGQPGGEGLVLDFADLAAIHGVGGVAVESVEVEVLRPTAYFFVGREPDANGGVRDLGVGQQHLEGGHDLGDASFVVGAQQGGAV